MENYLEGKCCLSLDSQVYRDILISDGSVWIEGAGRCMLEGAGECHERDQWSLISEEHRAEIKNHAWPHPFAHTRGCREIFPFTSKSGLLTWACKWPSHDGWSAHRPESEDTMIGDFKCILMIIIIITKNIHLKSARQWPKPLLHIGSLNLHNNSVRQVL